MKRNHLVLSALLLSSTAAAVPVDLGPPNQTLRGESPSYHFAGLNGTPLAAGETLSIDLRFDNNQFVRLWDYTDRGFGIGFSLTAPATQTGILFAGAVASCYTLGADGERNSAVTTHTPGLSFFIEAGQLGYIGTGFFPLWTVDSESNIVDVRPGQFDFYGVHFDLLVPEGWGAVTNGTLRFWAYDNQHPRRTKYFVGPHVPEGGSGLAMLGLGLTAIWFSLLYGRHRKVSRNFPVDHIAEAHGFRGSK